MYMKKYWLMTALWATAAAVCCSCDDDNDPVVSPSGGSTDVISDRGAYVVNNGNWNANNGSIQFYYSDKDSISDDLYRQANGNGIGDAQDLCIYGSKLYVTCTTSAKLEVLDLQGEIIQTIPLTNSSGQPVQPRYLAADGGKVYFSAYDGTVSRLDTLSLEVEASVEVGSYPEAIAITDNKLYANISGYGVGNEVAVVDLASFTRTDLVEVLLNPYDQMLAAGGKIYFVSVGNYSSPSTPEEDRILSTLQCLDPATNEVPEQLCQASAISYYDNKIYCIYAEYNWPDNQDIFVYDLATGEQQSLIDPDLIPNPTAIDVDPESGDIYIASPDYTGVPGTVYVFNNDGTPKTSFTAGYAVAGMRFFSE